MTEAASRRRVEDTPRAAVRGRPVDPRTTLVGLLIVVTALAFENLAVATVMPVVGRALHGLGLYAWAFSAYLTTSVVGMVVAGRWADRAGPVPAFLSGLAVFAAGLLVAGSAATMPVFVAGRAVQGFGAGENIVALYVVIARAYPEDARPRVFAAISGAWVLPSVVGPAVAGAVAEHLGWRWVFYGLPPLVLAGLALLVPALRGLPTVAATPTPVSRRSLTAAVGAAVGVAALQAAGQQLRWWSVPLAAAAAAVLLAALHRLLPPGALRMSRGLPAVVASRGLLAGGFFGAEAFLPLDLQTVHGLSPSLSGLPLTLGAVGWFAGSWYQGHRYHGDRYRLVRLGFLLSAAAVGGLTALTYRAVTPWLAVPLWALGGAGMGIAMATVGVLTLELSPVDEQGGNSAALQIADAVGTTLCLAIGGTLLAAGRAAGHGTGVSVREIFTVMATVSVVGWVTAPRVRPRSPG